MAPPRRQLALGALALPILGLMGMFAWAGADTGPSPISLVRSFLSAFDSRDCPAMHSLLASGPSLPVASCSALTGVARHHEVLHCSLTGGGVDRSLRAPVGYGPVSTVTGVCTEGPARGSVGSTVRKSLTFYVSTDRSSGTTHIIGIDQTPT